MKKRSRNKFKNGGTNPSKKLPKVNGKMSVKNTRTPTRNRIPRHLLHRLEAEEEVVEAGVVVVGPVALVLLPAMHLLEGLVKEEDVVDPVEDRRPLDVRVKKRRMVVVVVLNPMKRRRRPLLPHPVSRPSELYVPHKVYGGKSPPQLQLPNHQCNRTNILLRLLNP
jgi:hypothetical protein